jgi:hypothetical protein
MAAGPTLPITFSKNDVFLLHGTSLPRGFITIILEKG